MVSIKPDPDAPSIAGMLAHYAYTPEKPSPRKRYPDPDEDDAAGREHGEVVEQRKRRRVVSAVVKRESEERPLASQASRSSPFFVKREPEEPAPEVPERYSLRQTRSRSRGVQPRLEILSDTDEEEEAAGGVDIAGGGAELEAAEGEADREDGGRADRARRRARQRLATTANDTNASSSSLGDDDLESDSSEPDLTPRARATTTPRTPRTPRTPQRRNDGSLEGYGWRRPRAYADPVSGAYAHISGLPDHLRSDLDVVFIGINPGTRSGSSGHFFAHPTNKFWRALYGAGFTERVYSPEEDGTLLRRRVGLTNLVERVTAQAAELSGHEQRVAVAPLSRKLARHAPRVACFVGKMIWDTYAGVVRRSFKEREEREARERREAVVGPSTPARQRVVEYTLTNGVVTPSPSRPAVVDDEPLVKIESEETPQRSQSRNSSSSAKPKPKSKSTTAKTPVVFDAPQTLRLVSDSGEHTYFWVVPNTSGLERTRLDQQIVYFSKLKRFADSLARGEVPEGEFVDVYVQDVQAVVDKMREAGR